MSQSQPTNLESLARRCAHCSLRHLCLPAGINKAELSDLELRVKKTSAIEEGRFLFHAGDSAQSLYVVRFGSIKSIRIRSDGDEQIVGVHLAGEVFGLDGLATRTHSLDAITLEKTGVCAIGYEQLDDVLEEMPTLNRQLMTMMSREVADQHGHQVLMGRKSAMERVAMFLLRYSERLELRGFVGESFSLSLSRQDLANYLGLQIETVSRTFGKLRDQGVIDVDRRLVSINDFAALREAGGLEANEAVCF